MRISDWSSDVCSSDLSLLQFQVTRSTPVPPHRASRHRASDRRAGSCAWSYGSPSSRTSQACRRSSGKWRSEEHTSELQSLMRSSYAVFCLKKKKRKHKPAIIHTQDAGTTQLKRLQ